MNDAYFTLKNAQEQAQKYPDTFQAPLLEQLRGLVFPDVYVKVCGGVHDYYDRFWCKVIAVDGDNLFGEVANHLCIPNHAAKRGIGIPEYGTTIAFKMQHIYQLPILSAPIGMRVCEIQVCAMHNLINGGGSVLADGGYEHGSLEVNGYDVLVRYCDIGDDPAEPDDILHIDDWSFTYGEDAAFFANYLCNLYTPDYTPEWI